MEQQSVLSQDYYNKHRFAFEKGRLIVRLMLQETDLSYPHIFGSHSKITPTLKSGLDSGAKWR